MTQSEKTTSTAPDGIPHTFTARFRASANTLFTNATRPFTTPVSCLLSAVSETDVRLPSERQLSSVMETGSDQSRMFAK